MSERIKTAVEFRVQGTEKNYPILKALEQREKEVANLKVAALLQERHEEGITNLLMERIAAGLEREAALRKILSDIWGDQSSDGYIRYLQKNSK